MNAHQWYHLVCHEEQYSNPLNPITIFANREALEGRVVCVVCMYTAKMGVQVTDQCPYSTRTESTPTSHSGSTADPSIESTPTRNDSIRNTVRMRHFTSNTQVV